MKHRRNVPISEIKNQILSSILTIDQMSIDDVDQLFCFEIEQVLFDDQYDKTLLMAFSARLEKENYYEYTISNEDFMAFIQRLIKENHIIEQS